MVYKLNFTLIKNTAELEIKPVTLLELTGLWTCCFVLPVLAYVTYMILYR